MKKLLLILLVSFTLNSFGQYTVGNYIISVDSIEVLKDGCYKISYGNICFDSLFSSNYTIRIEYDTFRIPEDKWIEIEPHFIKMYGGVYWPNPEIEIKHNKVSGVSIGAYIAKPDNMIILKGDSVLIKLIEP